MYRPVHTKRTISPNTNVSRFVHIVTFLPSVAVWYANALASVKVVALRGFRLVSGWVIVLGRVNRLDMKLTSNHPSQLSLAIPPLVGAMNTSESWDIKQRSLLHGPKFVLKFYFNRIITFRDMAI